MKIAIVGPEESKWEENLKPRAKWWIEQILNGEKKFNKATLPIVYNSVKILDHSGKNVYYPITLVSGHCPKGGVDIWAEEIAYKLEISKEIYPAKTNCWKDYRSRNIQIAKTCDILFCIVPSHLYNYCKHCEKHNHPSNGGCWTMKYAKTLGKETHLVII